MNTTSAQLWVMSGLVTFAAAACAGDAPFTRVELELAPGKDGIGANPKGATKEEIQASLSAFFTKKYKGFDPNDPGSKSLCWFLSLKTGKNAEGVNKVSAKYHNWSVPNFNNYQRYSEALAKTGLPASFQNAWRHYYAKRMIEYRVPLPVAEETARMAAIPKGKVVTVGNAAELDKAIGEASPEFAKWSPEQRRAVMSQLAYINGAMRPVGYYRLPKGKAVKETWPHAAQKMPDGRTHVDLYRLEDAAPILIPGSAWFNKAKSGKAPELIGAGPAEKTEYAWYELQLEGAARQDVPMQLTLLVSNEHVQSAFATYPTLNNRVHEVVPLHNTAAPKPTAGGSNGAKDTWLTVKSNAIKGWAEVLGTSKKLQIDASIDGVKIKGSWSGVIQERKKQRKVSGNLTGSALGSKCPFNSAIPSEANWPWFFGPNDDGSATSSKQEMVKHLEDADLAWVAAEPIPDGRGIDSRGRAKAVRKGQPIMGGWSSPIVNNGKVYLYYYVPSGKAYAYGADQLVKKAAPELYRMSKINADDVLHCYDAASGRTLWKRAYPGLGVNWAGFNKGGPQLTPATDGKRVYVMGSTGRVYAMDAETGDAVWQTDIGFRHCLLEAMRKSLIAQKKMYGSRNDFQGNVVVVDGVVVVSDHRRTKNDYRYEVDNGLIGLDAATGKRLWHRPAVTGARCFQCAQVIRVEGKRFLIVGNKFKGVLLIDPRTGKTVAQQKGMTLPHTGFAIAGDIVVCEKYRSRHAPDDGSPSIRAFKATTSGFKKAWSLPIDYAGLVGAGLHLDGHLYLQFTKPSLQITCVDPKTGKMLAQVPADVARGEHCPFIIGGDGRLIVCKDRTTGLLMADTNPEKMKESLGVWPFRLATGYCGSIIPALVDGRLICRLPSRLICLDLRNAKAPKRKHGNLVPRQSGVHQPKGKGKRR